MRNCPICLAPYRRLLVKEYNGIDWSLYRCGICDMLYLDSPAATEATLDVFYKKVYRTDDAPYSTERLENLATFLCNFPLNAPLVDVGGTDGCLAQILSAKGFSNVAVHGPGDVFNGVINTFVFSHTLEHIYNPDEMLRSVKRHIAKEGVVVVEGPIWEDVTSFTYDYHFQHINKFTKAHLERLFYIHGFRVALSTSISPYREYLCHRLVAYYD